MNKDEEYKGVVAPDSYNQGASINDPRLKEGFYFHGGTIQDNHTYYYGGAIYNYEGGIVYMKGENGGTPTISGNLADEFGGGVMNEGLFIMIDGTIHNNRARYGGGVCATLNMFVMEAGNITHNRATSAGGGVFAFSGSFFMMGGSLGGAGTYQSGGLGNYADSFGGGVAVYPEGNFAMAGGIIEGNACSANYNGNANSGTGNNNRGFTGYGTIGFFDSDDPYLLGLIWYGKRPTGAIPGDPAIIGITTAPLGKESTHPNRTFTNKYGNTEPLLLSYLVPKERDWTTGLVTVLQDQGGGTRIQVRDGKLYYGNGDGVTPVWVNSDDPNGGDLGYVEEYPAGELN
jgi:hypothetical protein